MDLGTLLFWIALAALGLVLVAALRHRILFAMAFRNTQRRPRQSILIVLGLLVGSALVSAAFVTSDSMEYAIVQATYDAFLEIDETVYLPGYNFFPQSVVEDLSRDPDLDRVTDAIGGNVIWSAAITNERSRLYEPGVRLVGFDPVADAPFGAFRAGGGRFTGEALAPDEVVLDRRAANDLGAEIGDTLTLNFSKPLDPLLPRFEELSGHIDVSATPGLPPPFPQQAEPEPWERPFSIDGTVVTLSAVLRWNQSQGQDLDLELRDPDGRVYANTTGTVLEPDGHVVNVTGSLAAPVRRGEWSVRVYAEAAADLDFDVTLVRLEPVYNLTEFERRVDELRERFGDYDPAQDGGLFERETRTVRVAWISDGGKAPHFQLPTPLNAYVRLDAIQQWLDRPGEINFAKVSNNGGVESGPEGADEAFPVLWDALNRTKSRQPEHPAVQALQAGNDKVFWLEQAKRIGEQFGIFLAFISSFAVLAGLLLIVNIFTMLAEERKTELGISRAVGLRRAHLTRLFTIEGALYAVVATAAGVVAGLGLAWGLIRGFNAFGDSDVFPPIPFRLETASLRLAFALGILLTLGTVYLGARRASRLNVVRAIRNLEEPEHLRTSAGLWGGLVVGSGGSLLSAWAVLARSFPLGVVGPTLLVLGIGLLLRRVLSRRRIYPALAILLFAYLTTTLFAVKEYETFEDNLFGPVRAVIMALCLVVVVVYSEAAARAMGRLIARVPPLRAVARPAASYPLHRRFRTGMTLSMFAVILLVVVMFSIFGAIFQPNTEKESGGYDLEAYATVPITRLEDHGDNPALLDLVAHYDVVPFFLQYGGDLVTVSNGTTAQFGPPRDYIFGFDARFADANRFELAERDAAYATDADAYRAVAQEDGLVIVSNHYSHDEHGNDGAHHVGEPLQLRAGGSARTFRVVGIQDQFHFKAIWLPNDLVRTLYPNADTLILIALKPGVDDEQAAKDFEAAYRDVGMDALSIRKEILEQNESFRQIFTLIQLFLGLGLIIGILSLGIVTARSIIERRQEIGMMRALGFRRRDVRRAFLLEMSVLVGLGILVGAAVAFVVSFGIWATLIREQDLPYTVPWIELGVIALIAFVATTFATLAPIVKASRIPAAEALRYIE